MVFASDDHVLLVLDAWPVLILLGAWPKSLRLVVKIIAWQFHGIRRRCG
jgi:hypothetical protein